VLYIAVEAGLSATFPVPVLVVINGGSTAQQAEKLVCRGTNHDSHMSVPDDQIGRFRIRHLPESFHTIVQIVGICIGIRKPSVFIYGMHQMGAITSCMANLFGVQRHSDH